LFDVEDYSKLEPIEYEEVMKNLVTSIHVLFKWVAVSS